MRKVKTVIFRYVLLFCCVFRTNNEQDVASDAQERIHATCTKLQTMTQWQTSA